MDFLDPAKKRAHNRRLFIGYLLVAIAIAMASFILLLLSYGYSLDRKTGQVVQNGLIFLSAKPAGADVYINGERKDGTDLRLSLPEGQYEIELRKTGYTTWEKSLYLEGGSIEQLVYPLMFPAKPVTVDEQLYADNPRFVTQSPNRRWLLIQPTADTGKLELFDTSKPGGTQTPLSLPAGLLTASTGAQRLSAVEWSSDNRSVLVKHSYGKNVEHVIINAINPNRSLNVSRYFNAAPSQVTLRNKNAGQLYFYDARAKTVSLADVSNKQVKALLNDVIQFKPYAENEILYVSAQNAPKGNHTVSLFDGSKSYPVRNLPIGKAYRLDKASYDGADYTVLGSADASDIYIYKNVLRQAKSGKLPSAFIGLRIKNPNFVSFSAGTRFVIAQNGSNFAVYDLENSRRHYFKLEQKIASSSKAVWMDNHRLSIVSGGNTIIFDFDGNYASVLSKSSDGFGAYFDGSYGILYNIAPSTVVPKRQALTRTTLIVSK